MYRRRRGSRTRRSFSRRPVQSITHNPGVVNQTVSNNTVIAKVFINAKATGITSTQGVDVSDRNVDVSSGSKVFSVRFNQSAQMNSQTLDEINGGLLSYVIVKRTQAETVPSAGDISVASIQAKGLQNAARQLFPGRVLRYGQIAITQAVPATRQFRINLKKYRMANMRQGDFLVIYYFWTSSAAGPAVQSELLLSTEAFYKEYK